MGGRARRRDLDVSPAQRRGLLRRPSDHGRGRPVFSFEVVYDETPASRACRRSCRSAARSSRSSAPDPYTVVINTVKAARGPARCALPGHLAIMPKHVLEACVQERQLRLGLQRQHAAGQARHERRMASRAVRAERKDGARPQSVLLRLRPEQSAAAVPRRARLSRRSRSGRRRSEVPLWRRRRRRRCEAGKLSVVRGEPEAAAISRCTISAPRRAPTSSGST